MPHGREARELQLAKVKDLLSAHTKKLKDKQIEPAKHRLDPVWRKLNADVRAMAARLKRIGDIETQNKELIAIKEQKLATPKVKKEKKKPAAPAPKAKAKAKAKPAAAP